MADPVIECMVGKELQKDMNEVKEGQSKILDILSDNKMILSEIKNINEVIKESKIDNNKIHDLLFKNHDLLLKKVELKSDKCDADKRDERLRVLESEQHHAKIYTVLSGKLSKKEVINLFTIFGVFMVALELFLKYILPK